MKVLVIALALGLSACSWETVHTEKYSVDSNGTMWERHYLIIPYESPCVSKSSCDALHKGEPTYNMRTHKMEAQ